MKTKNLKIEFDKNITEQRLVEHCLNLESSGGCSMLAFSLYAFINHWHLDKFLYYQKLVDEQRGTMSHNVDKAT